MVLKNNHSNNWTNMISISPRLKLLFIILLIIGEFVYLIDATPDQVIYNNKENQCKNGHKQKSTNIFSWPDYLVLTAMLVVSCGIGLFYGFFDSKQPATSNDFLLGGSSMGTFPMAMSLAASFVTAVELLGNPSEMYNYGSQFWMICIAFILVIPLTSRFYLPVFMKLRLTSSYEYLSIRFNSTTRYLASGFYIMQMTLYTSVAVYAPALALSHVTGLNVYMAVSLVYVVCIFYASQGGMKAVIIADTFQAGVLIGSIVLIVLLGERFVGGTEIIWSVNYKTDRLVLFNLNPSPTIRHSFWSVVFGGTFYWMTMFCSNQASIQKYLSVENISQVRKALWTSCIGLIFIYTVNFYTGMVLVAHYRDCDPLKVGDITASDQILPLYVISQLGQYRGITGFFVAGIFAASLGTVASALNSLAAVTMQDFITEALGVRIHETHGAIWAKSLSIAYGAISFLMVFVVAQLGSVMQVAISFNGMVGGVTLGLFSLGMFFPWANSKGAITGSITAFILITVMCVGQQVSIANGSFGNEDQKATSIENCCLNSTILSDQTLSATLTYHNSDSPSSSVFLLYRISYIWYSAIGFFVTTIIGLIVSFMTGADSPADVDSDLISPPIFTFLQSLSNRAKELLNIPLKSSGGNGQSVAMKEQGVVNLGLDMTFDDNVGVVVKRDCCNQVNNNGLKVRKVSAPC